MPLIFLKQEHTVIAGTMRKYKAINAMHVITNSMLSTLDGFPDGKE